ncbi:hypothetical protein Vlu01_27120 [Micromonospora lutea]|uniref:Uncharacterized protein n=1 Tax=Micromonospora lutea TaxID=419825 RepID=A0ABQ4IVY4_9ACTN|nr:hypothetical protein Vlu01_27120 [Micromonospora lutea]
MARLRRAGEGSPPDRLTHLTGKPSATGRGLLAVQERLHTIPAAGRAVPAVGSVAAQLSDTPGPELLWCHKRPER